jgi:hypothetical protein
MLLVRIIFKNKNLFLRIIFGAKGSEVELFWGGFGIILSPKP